MELEPEPKSNRNRVDQKSIGVDSESESVKAGDVVEEAETSGHAEAVDEVETGGGRRGGMRGDRGEDGVNCTSLST
uniref:Uncharacterized protein n=1 Tax=Oryza sativa subsp. japonica TaxID=39947 RepID=Q69TN0_ORYSJ|nr:hypothetical protein [Oryza sativa Japonica Group]